MSKLEEALEKANELREANAGKKVGDTGGTAEKTNKSIKSAADLRTKGFKVPEKVKSKVIDNHKIVTITQPDSAIAEEYRRLKSMLIRETKADFLNTIMITSSINGEGKSLTAINLAITLAQEIDHTILLIDADLRKPMIHKYLGIEYKYGLSDYLTQDIDISEILLKTGIGNMVLIPAGRVVENPVELLSSEKMKTLIDEVKHRYMDRYVIIDTPPILSCAEGIAIGSYTNGVLFVVEEGRAQRKMIQEALNMIQGLNILGVVYNNASKANLEGHYSYNYYGYGRKDGK
jgi:exopolysaccharide/PEP-CTERM locus tyrosine autokinase